MVYKLEIGIFGFNYTVWGLVFTMIGAFIISTSGYFYIKYKKNGSLHKLNAIFTYRHPDLFSDYEESPNYIQNLIQNVESEALEFKSTFKNQSSYKKC